MVLVTHINMVLILLIFLSIGRLRPINAVPGCNDCSANSVFACTGPNSFALCLGKDTVSFNLFGSCGPDLVCNHNLPYICGDPKEGITASCQSIEIPPQIPSDMSKYAKEFCQVIKINTRFAVPFELVNNNKSYVYCFLTANGTWSGQIYTCAGSTYFDDQTKYCMVNKPPGC